MSKSAKRKGSGKNSEKDSEKNLKAASDEAASSVVDSNHSNNTHNHSHGHSHDHPHPHDHPSDHPPSHPHSHATQSAEENREAQQMKLQKKYVEMQVLDAQIKQIQKQMASLEGQEEEMREVLNCLSDFSSLENDKEMYVPLTSGIFVKAQIKDTSHILMNVGSGTVVKKSIAEGKTMIAKQLKEVEKVKEQLLAEFQKMALKAEETEKELMGALSQ